MHIAYDAAPLLKKHKGGVGFAQADAVLSLSRAHPKDRFSLLYFSLRTPKKKRGRLAPYLRPNVELVPCPFYSGRLYRSLYGLFPVPFSLFFPRRADVTHCFDFLIPPGVRGKTVVSVPDTAYIHYPDSVPPLKRLLLRFNMPASLSRADVVLTASEYMREELIEHYGIDEKKVRVVYTSVDTARFSPNLDLARIHHVCESYGIRGEYILYMGATSPRKNLLRLIDAYAALLPKLGENPPKLVLAGKRGLRYERLEKKVARRGLKKHVVFCGYVSERDKPYLLCGARLFAFPSLSEGVGAPVLEAMACGVPVLTAAVGALPEVCADGAFFVDPKSTAQIREGLWQLLCDERLRFDVISRAQRRISDPCFSRAQNAERLYRIYSELCEKK